LLNEWKHDFFAAELKSGGFLCLIKDILNLKIDIYRGTFFTHLHFMELFEQNGSLPDSTEYLTILDIHHAPE